MSGLRPKERLVAGLQILSAPHEHAGIFLVIFPLVLSVGVVLWLLIEVRFYVAIAGPALLAYALLIDALCLNPPNC